MAPCNIFGGAKGSSVIEAEAQTDGPDTTSTVCVPLQRGDSPFDAVLDDPQM